MVAYKLLQVVFWQLKDLSSLTPEPTKIKVGIQIQNLESPNNQRLIS